MKLPGEAGGNWSERQTKARTYGHGLQLYSAAVGRRVGHLLPTLFSRRISDPFAIVNPGHSSSSARAELFHSSCQLRELQANVEPVKLRGSSAAQGEGCTRDCVLVCRLRDCDATPRTRSQSYSRARARARSYSHTHRRREQLNSSPLRTCMCTVFSTAFSLIRDLLIERS